jgi:hypothetical protein
MPSMVELQYSYLDKLKYMRNSKQLLDILELGCARRDFFIFAGINQIDERRECQKKESLITLQ